MKKRAEPHNPHNAFFGGTMRQKRVASSFLKRYLPSEVRGLVDLRTLPLLEKLDKELLRYVLKYISVVGESEHMAELLRMLCEEIRHKEEDQTMGMTLAQYLFEQGEIQGKKEGKQEGRLEGKREGSLLGQLRKAKEIACRLLEKNMRPEEVAYITQLELKVVEKLLVN